MSDNKLKQKHIVIYDRLWWIQGQRALLLKQHHPDLEIMSYYDFLDLIKSRGANKINREYDVISTLGLWTAERLIRRNVRVHASRSEEHTSELQSRFDLVCRLLLDTNKHH